MKFTKPGFGIQCLLALILGAIFGKCVPISWMQALHPLGQAYLQLLQMIIIPLIFVLVVNSFTQLESMAHIRRLGSRTLFWFLLTALIASFIGFGCSYWLDPGQGFPADQAPITLKHVPTFAQVLLDMLPNNLFDQMARGKVIPIILFGIVFAVALALGGDEVQPVRQFFAGLASVFMKITRWIIRLSPIGIFVFIGEVTNKYGFSNLLPFARFILTVYLACALQLLVYGFLLLAVCRINPLRFLQRVWPALLTAFTTSSSLATLPVTVETLSKRVGISEQIVSFVAPLGANAKMDGCGATYPVIVCLFTASLFHISLGWHQYLLIILTATVASIGTAGVPGTATVTAMVVLSSVGLPFAGLAMVLGIDKVIDMVRTLVNVAGTMVTATLVAGRAATQDLSVINKSET